MGSTCLLLSLLRLPTTGFRVPNLRSSRQPVLAAATGLLRWSAKANAFRAWSGMAPEPGATTYSDGPPSELKTTSLAPRLTAILVTLP